MLGVAVGKCIQEGCWVLVYNTKVYNCVHNIMLQCVVLYANSHSQHIVQSVYNGHARGSNVSKQPTFLA